MDFAGAYSPANLSFLMQGLWITLEVAAVSIVLSFVIGILLALLRYAKIPVLSQIIMLWVELIRNVPLLLIIFFFFFALPDAFKFKITEIQAAIAALTVFESAMISEIIRSGLNSIPKGHIEAARSSGLTYLQTLRFIVLPQALRRMIPPLVSQFISLLKDTSLAIIISLPEMLHNGQIIYNHSQSYVFPTLILVALIYFAINYCLSLIAGRLERRYSN
jgi:aspartate/glutamate/glutamine transport system permease protein